MEEAVLRDLGVISELQVHDKLYVDDTRGLRIDTPYWYRASARWWSGQNRDRATQRINHVLQNAWLLLDRQETKNNHRELLLKRLDAAQNGLTNLIVTYRDDASVTTSLNTTLELLSMNLNQVKHQQSHK